MNLLSDDNLEQLFSLSAAVSLVADTAEAFRHAKKIISKLIPCDDLLLFFDDYERECLAAPREVNNLSDIDTKEITISYNDPLANKLLLSRQTITRSSTTNSVLPFMQNELIVPIISPESVLGCLYLGRRVNSTFNLREKMFAEHMASILEMPIERLRWEERWQRSRRTSQRWHEKYLAILESLPFPATIVDLSNDSFGDANSKFLQLIQLRRQELAETNVSDVFRLPEPLATLSKEKVQYEGAVEIVKKEKTGKIDARFMRVKTVSSMRYLAIFQTGTSVTRETPNEDWVSQFLTACDHISSKASYQDALLNPARVIAGRHHAAFVTVHVFDTEEEFNLSAAYKYDSGDIFQPTEQVCAGLAEGPYNNIVKSGQSYFVNDVETTSSFAPWLPVAHRLGYRAMASVPMKILNKSWGLCTVFKEKPCNWSKQAMRELKNMAHVLAYLIYEKELLGEFAEQSHQISVLDEITKAANVHKDIYDIIEVAALQLKKIVHFDYLSFTLFRESGQEAEIIDLASMNVKKRLNSNWSWHEIPAKGLGWVSPSPSSNEKMAGMLPARPGGMPSSMPSHTSVLLLSRDNYMGNCALGRLSERPFSRTEIQFLRQFASHIAIAIENALQYQKMLSRSEEKSGITQVDSIGINSLEFDEIKQNLCKATKTALNTSLCDIIWFDTRTEVAELFYWMPDSLSRQLSYEKLDHYIEIVERDQITSVFDSPKKFVEQLCVAGLNSRHLQLFQPFIFSPVIHEDHLIAVIVIAWEQGQRISDHDIDVITNITDQAHDALANSNLHRQSLQKIEELERFVYSVSHDLKSPIQSIKSFTSLIKEEVGAHLPEHPLNYFQRISANLDQMEKLVTDLLDLSRLGRSTLRFKNHLAAGIIRDAMDSLAGLFKSGEIHFNIAPELPQIYCDRTQMVQVFTNLISNGIKFTKGCSNPTIDIGCQEFRKYYEFFVSDNGIGIAPEIQDKIFGLFHTSTKNESDGGTGVGLAIVKKVLELHRGDILVESSPGKGAQFKFTIPKVSLKQDVLWDGR